jgi:hypothetical protein
MRNLRHQFAVVLLAAAVACPTVAWQNNAAPAGANPVPSTVIHQHPAPSASTAANMRAASVARKAPAGKSSRRAPEPDPQPETPAPPPTPEQLPPSPPQVTYANGELTIVSQNATLAEVLSQVRARTGANLELPPGAGMDRVATQLGPGKPRDVLVALLTGSRFDYIIVGSPTDPEAVQRVILTKRQSANAPAVASGTPAGQPAGRAQEGAFRQPVPPPQAAQEMPPDIDEDASDREIPDEAAQQPQPEGQPQPGQPGQPAPNFPGQISPGQPGQPNPNFPGQVIPGQPQTTEQNATQPGQPGQHANPNQPGTQPKTPEQLLQELQQMQRNQQQGQEPTGPQPTPNNPQENAEPE